MQSGNPQQSPVGYKIRGTSLYYNNHTGYADWSGCQRCVLATGRRIVALRQDGKHTYGATTPVKLLFIGSAPDSTDGATGIPFSGFAGRVLRFVIKELKHSITYCMTHEVCCPTRDIVKLFKPDGTECFATDDEEADAILYTPGTYAEYANIGRLPRPKEKQLCSPHVDQLINSFKPKGIVTVGYETNYSPRKNIPILRLFASYGPTPFQQYIEKTEYKLLHCRREANKLSRFIQELSQ